MSGSMSSSSAVVGDGYRPPFTAVQWQELEHQALIYKYLLAGLPVPPDLVIPIRRSFEAMSSRFFHQSALGYCSYYGKKFDPEPGRCRRTDGKKWRCSKDAYPDSKYCERHMHRGKNRSRKPVESQPTSQLSINSSSVAGCYQNGGSGNFQSMPLYSNVNTSESLRFGSNLSKLQLEAGSYGIKNKDYRYVHGLASDDAKDHNVSSEASPSIRGLGMESSIDNAWGSLPSEIPSNHFLKPANESYMRSAQHCFFSSEMGSVGQVKQDHQSVRPFLDEWPKARESWSDLEDSKNGFSTTQLTISTPMASPSEFSLKSACSPK